MGGSHLTSLTSMSMIVEGLLVQAPSGRVRLILGHYCFDFEDEDIVDVDELPPPPGLIEGSAIPARVTINVGARLFQIRSSEPYSSVLFRHVTPFVFASRSQEPAPGDESFLRARETEFFNRRGLIAAPKVMPE